jgi:hypothetical protein
MSVAELLDQLRAIRKREEGQNDALSGGISGSTNRVLSLLP